MKRTLTALLLILTVSITNAQNFKELADTNLTTKQEYKFSETNVIHSVDYLFSTPHHSSNNNRVLAQQFITKWMQGTPDYTFNVDQKVASLTEGNEDLLALYMAGMAKVSIENNGLSSDEIHGKTAQMVAKYCSNRKNKMKPTAELKKIMKNKKG